MGKLIREFQAETIPQLDDVLLLAKPDNTTKSLSLARARDIFVADLALLPEKLTDLRYSFTGFRSQAIANFAAIAAIDADQDMAIAGKSNIGHHHVPEDIEGFEIAIIVQDETTPLGNAKAFNFVGAGIRASLTDDIATILVSGLGAGGGSNEVWDTIDLSSWDALY